MNKNASPRLLDLVRAKIRVKHYSIRTQAYKTVLGHILYFDILAGMRALRGLKLSKIS